MIEQAKQIVREYINQHLENPDAGYTIFVIWQARVLQHFKCLIATTLPHGMYFELTYDGDRGCWYFDVYRKVENREIWEVADGVHQQPGQGADH